MQMDKPSKDLQVVLDKLTLQDQLQERTLLLQRLEKLPTRTTTILAMLKVDKGDAYKQQVARTQQEIRARAARTQLAKSREQLSALLGKAKNGK